LGGVVFGAAETTRTLTPGEYQDITYSWSRAGEGLHHIFAVVDPANAVTECREDDNRTGVDVTVSLVQPFPDLKIGTEDITMPAGAFTEGSIIPITAAVGTSALPLRDVSVSLYLGSPSAGGVQIGATTAITSLDAGGSIPAVFSFDTLAGRGTTWYILPLTRITA